MIQFETLRRRLYLIHLVEWSHLYSIKAELFQRVSDEDGKFVLEQTIEHDIEAMHTYTRCNPASTFSLWRRTVSTTNNPAATFFLEKYNYDSL